MPQIDAGGKLSRAGKAEDARSAQNTLSFLLQHQLLRDELTLCVTNPRLKAFLSEALVRDLWRSLLVAWLVATLVDLPMAAAANRILGFVLAAQSSQIDGIAAASGSNVYAGDSLLTNADGRIQLRFGVNQIYMPASSAVTLTTGADGLMAMLSSGTLEFASPRGTEIAVRAEDVVVRPKTAAATHAQVTVLSNKELRIASVTGPLELQLDGELYNLTAGRTYIVKIVDDGGKTQYAEYQPARGRRKLIIAVFVGTAAVAAIIYLVQELHESPAVP